MSDDGMAVVTLVLKFPYDDEVDYARTIVEIYDRSIERCSVASIDVERRPKDAVERR